MSGVSQICSGKNRQYIDWKSEINTDNKNPQLKERKRSFHFTPPQFRDFPVSSPQNLALYHRWGK
jgi:hypothetical protein